MKKTVITAMVLGIGLSSFGQKHNKKEFKHFSPEQRTELAVKRMTLKLDLTPEQQSKIKPVLTENFKQRELARNERKASKDKKEKLTSDDRFAIQSKHLDQKIAFKNDMKRILNNDQFERFEKMANRRMCKTKKGRHSRKRTKRRS